jgi:hypothetical protein
MIIVATDIIIGLDIGTFILAAFGAVTGSIALSFQIYSSVRTWKTRLEISIGLNDIFDANQNKEVVASYRMVNHSGHIIRVTHVGMAPKKRKENPAWIPRPYPLSQPLPIEIAARDSSCVWVPIEEFKAFASLDEKVRAQVWTSDGKRFRSKKTKLSRSSTL